MTLDKLKRYIGLAISLVLLVLLLPVGAPSPGPRLTALDKTPASIIAMESSEHTREWRTAMDFQAHCGGRNQRLFMPPSAWADVTCDQLFRSVSGVVLIDLAAEVAPTRDEARALADKVIEYRGLPEQRELAEALSAALNDKVLTWHVANESSLRSRVYLSNALALGVFLLALWGRVRTGGWVVSLVLAIGRLFGLGGNLAKRLHDRV